MEAWRGNGGYVQGGPAPEEKKVSDRRWRNSLVGVVQQNLCVARAGSLGPYLEQYFDPWRLWSLCWAHPWENSRNLPKPCLVRGSVSPSPSPQAPNVLGGPQLHHTAPAGWKGISGWKRGALLTQPPSPPARGAGPLGAGEPAHPHPARFAASHAKPAPPPQRPPRPLPARTRRARRHS